MIIKINAEEVASKLALYDAQTLYFSLAQEEISEKDIMDFIDGKVIPSLIFTHEERKKNIQYFYQKQHDYYFKNLTNLQL